MANRLMANRQYSFERDIKTLFAHVTIGATGAPTLDGPNSLGVLSITRGTAGLYTVTFGTSVNGVNTLDTYFQFVQMAMDVKNATGVVITATFGIKSIDVSNPALCSITFQTLGGVNSIVATDPASGDELFLMFKFSDSSAA